MAERKTAITATGVVQKHAGYYWGYTVTTALSAAAVTLQDGITAAGTVVDVIPASTAAGTTKIFATPVKLDAGLFATVAGTGTILFLTD